MRTCPVCRRSLGLEHFRSKTGERYTQRCDQCRGKAHDRYAHDPEARDRIRAQGRSYGVALRLLRDLHREEFEDLLALVREQET